jgi:PhnB protein
VAFGPNPPPIQAYIAVKDGISAIAFYEKAFGAVCTFKKMADDGRRVMHANLEVFGSEVMLHDEFPEFGGILMSPSSRSGASVGIHINLPKPSDVDAAVMRAESAGAIVVFKPEDTFWGARYAQVRDPSGHIWAFNAPLKVQD